MTGFLSIHEECKFRPCHRCVLYTSGAEGGSDCPAHGLIHSGLTYLRREVATLGAFPKCGLSPLEESTFNSVAHKGGCNCH